MNEDRLPRRLAAILYTDMEGYSRLASEDEDAAHRLLRKNLDLLAAVTKSFNGIVVNYAGDAMLARFESVTDALSCAIKAQQDLKACSDNEEKSQSASFRIGINLGDVIEDRDDIYGDGVNVAARLEGLAEPGGICISGTVYDAIGRKLPVDYQFMGEQQVKNIIDPVRVYRVLMSQPENTDAMETKQQSPDSDRVSIAVLPFTNMSGDPEQEYFSDGISEDIITDLSKISAVFVVARNSSFTYKGRSVKMQEISADLGVRYVVEGSVRKSGRRVRITAQLIDGPSGGHVWADRYDGTLDDIFELQDEVTEQIVEALKISLLPEEQEAISQVPTASLEAYERYLKGKKYFHLYTKNAINKAKKMFESAIASDGDYARAHCGLADCWTYLSTEHGAGVEALVDAETAAHAAIKLDGNLGEAYASLGLVLAGYGRYTEAETKFAKAVSLDPNLYEARYYWGRSCFAQGNLDEAANHLEASWKLSPKDPNVPSLLLQIYQSLGRQAEHENAANKAVELGLEKLELDPDNYRVRASLAFGLVNLGRHDEAMAHMDINLERNPGDANILYNAACMYCKVGDHDKALFYLEKSLQASHYYFVSGWVENDSDLDPLRDLPEFKRLVATYLDGDLLNR